jgi:hypothetical protein
MKNSLLILEWSINSFNKTCYPLTDIFHIGFGCVIEIVKICQSKPIMDKAVFESIFNAFKLVVY